jgi:hypothetical protein
LRVVLKLGWNATPLCQQLGRTDADVEHWQTLADAITRLQHEGLITWASSQSARKKLGARIVESHTKRKAA